MMPATQPLDGDRVADLIGSTRPAEVDPEADTPIEPPTTQPASQPATQASTQAGDVDDRPVHVNELANLPASTTPDAQALADILGGMVDRMLAQPQLPSMLARQADAMLTAAVRLDPTDSRLARQLVEVRLNSADAQSTLDALDHYRVLEPDDRVAQLQYVDLSADLLESADLRLAYFERLSGASAVPTEVRAHAALLAAILQSERLEDEQADAMLSRAVELDPYNPQIMTLNLQRTLSRDSTRAQRVGAMALLLRANPAQPALLAQLAAELGSAGLVDEASRMFRAAELGYAAFRSPPPISLLTTRAATLLVTNRAGEASRVVFSQRAPSQDEITELIGAADLNVLAATAAEQMNIDTRLPIHVGSINFALTALLRDVQLPDASEWTDENWAAHPLPDPTVLAEQLLEAPVPARMSAVHAMTSRAWLDLFHGERATDPRLLDAITRLSPEGSTVPARLSGWQAWRGGDVETARERLSAVSDRDALAELGLLLMRRGEGEDVTGEARALLNRVPFGVVGATIATAFRGEGVFLDAGDDADEIRSALAQLPERLLEVMVPERTRQFYAISAAPLQVRHTYGEPLLARVVIRNTGSDVITIGPGGLLQPTVRLDADVRGLERVQIPAAAHATIGGQTRLEPNSRIEQIVRLDGPRLRAELESKPQFTLTVFAEVVTNPITVQVQREDGTPGAAAAIGAAGQSLPFTRVIDRIGLPIDRSNEQIAAAINARLGELRDAEPLRRMRAAQEAVTQLRMIANLVEESRATPKVASEWQAIGGQIYEAMRVAANVARPEGTDVAANAWMRYTVAEVMAEPERRAILRPLLTATSFESRLIGLLGYSRLLVDAPDVREVLERFGEADPDPTVRRFALSQLAFVEAVAAQQEAAAATQPATQPTNGGTGAAP